MRGADKMINTTNDIFSREGRLVLLDDLYKRLMKVIVERAVAYGDDPIGRTGLYGRKFKILGRRYPLIVEEYSLDQRLLKQLAKTLKAAAIERREDQGGGLLPYEQYVSILNAGRDRVAAEAERKKGLATQEETNVVPLEGPDCGRGVEQGTASRAGVCQPEPKAPSAISMPSPDPA